MIFHLFSDLPSGMSGIIMSLATFSILTLKELFISIQCTTVASATEKLYSTYRVMQYQNPTAA